MAPCNWRSCGCAHAGRPESRVSPVSPDRGRRCGLPNADLGHATNKQHAPACGRRRACVRACRRPGGLPALRPAPARCGCGARRLTETGDVLHRAFHGARVVSCEMLSLPGFLTLHSNISADATPRTRIPTPRSETPGAAGASGQRSGEQGLAHAGTPFVRSSTIAGSLRPCAIARAVLPSPSSISVDAPPFSSAVTMASRLA